MAAGAQLDGRDPDGLLSDAALRDHGDHPDHQFDYQEQKQRFPGGAGVNYYREER